MDVTKIRKLELELEPVVVAERFVPQVKLD